MTTIATECPVCPKGIKACAHLGDMVVWLATTPESIQLWQWQVRGPAPLLEDDHIPWGGFHTDSLPDAEREFERRCALLRAEA